MKDKIAIIDPLSRHGGFHYYVHDQACALAQHGLEVIVASPAGKLHKDAPYDEIISFEGVFSRGSKIKRALVMIKEYGRSIYKSRSRNARIFIFHIFRSDILDLSGVAIARLFGGRAVCVVHDVERLDANSRFSLLRYMIALSTGIVVHNEFSKEELLRRYPEAGKKLAITPHGNYISHFQPLVSADQARQRLNLPKADTIFLFFGNPRHEKGLHILLESLKYSGRKRDFLVVVAGKMKPDDEFTHRQFVADNDLQDVVRFDVGHVSDEIVQHYYRAADIVVLPYLRVYESGVALMAASFERPIIASDLPVFRQMAEEGAGAMLFPVGSPQELGRALDNIINGQLDLQSYGNANSRYARVQRDWFNVMRPLAEMAFGR